MTGASKSWSHDSHLPFQTSTYMIMALSKLPPSEVHVILSSLSFHAIISVSSLLMFLFKPKKMLYLIQQMDEGSQV